MKKKLEIILIRGEILTNRWTVEIFKWQTIWEIYFVFDGREKIV